MKKDEFFFRVVFKCACSRSIKIRLWITIKDSSGRNVKKSLTQVLRKGSVCFCEKEVWFLLWNSYSGPVFCYSFLDSCFRAVGAKGTGGEGWDAVFTRFRQIRGADYTHQINTCLPGFSRSFYGLVLVCNTFSIWLFWRHCVT